MGIVRLPKVSYYWSKDKIMGQSFPATVMSRNRFELILQYLHFSNNESIDPCDRIDKIRELVNELNDNFKKYYTPNEYLCVDESMIPFRGRLIMLQFNKQKRHKYGIKVFKVCTIPGCTYKLQIYYGKNTDTTNNSPTNIVLSLCEELLNKGHSIATDNWYTSVQLAHELLKNDTHLFGTVRKNRRDLPKDVIDKKLRRGEFIVQENEDGVLVLKWKDKRDVLMLSTKRSADFATITKKGKSITKPKVVFDYNKAIRKTVKWYQKLAMEQILNTAVVNAFIMHREVTKINISIVEFRKLLVGHLTSEKDEEVEDKRSKRLKHELKRKEGKVSSTRRFCVSCYKESVKKWGSKLAKNKFHKVSTFCDQCVNKPHFCLPCFDKEHRHI